MQEELRKLMKMVELKMREQEVESADELGTLIGEIPTEIQEKLNKLHKVKEHLQQDTELRKRQLQLEAQRKMEAEFDERHDAYAKLHKETWNELYKTMLVDPNGYYFLDDGKLYTYREKEKYPQYKMVDFTKPSRR